MPQHLCGIEFMENSLTRSDSATVPLTPSHKEGPGHPAYMEFLHLPMPEEKEGGSLEE